MTIILFISIRVYGQDRYHGEPVIKPPQLKQLERLLLKGSFSLGFEDGPWTCPRIFLLIEKKFGLHYHPDAISKVLHRQLGWSVQRSQRKAMEQEEKKVKTWIKTEWPKILKKP